MNHKYLCLKENYILEKRRQEKKIKINKILRKHNLSSFPHKKTLLVDLHYFAWTKLKLLIIKLLILGYIVLLRYVQYFKF